MYPVLFVHGSGLSSATWDELRAHLVEAGYPETYLRAVDMHPRHGSNPRAARRYIAPAVEALLRNAQRHARTAALQSPAKVDIVAHSMGAISSRWYLALHRPDRIRRWIGIAPANHGTNALCGHPGAGDRELCPAFAATSRQSSVQFRLNGGMNSDHDETPYGLGLDRTGAERVPPEERRAIVYYTLRIDPDPWIVPADSAVLDGAGGLHLSFAARAFRETSLGNFLFLGAVDHDDLPKDQRVIDWVRAVLTAEEPKR
jgi:pimeloyl-ACP methyl ester carboxylesterase